ncbi:MAG: type IV toxin-antitoxin system AbiEi family antitoxin domain-containing protein [Thermodesulfobacteriota bacterium]|nr:type IV toxin-antitoxin system AbiEi family antitoxin domain-containing protein [Thermodesulfobacteriota bacterium]
MTHKNINRFEKTEKLFREHDGLLRTSQVLALGTAPATLYEMRDEGILVQESYGLYRLADIPPLSHPDFVKVALQVPKAVVCLISALSFHELTTQIPDKVHIALPKGTKRPRIDYPPIDVVHVSGDAYSAGIENHTLDGKKVRIYSSEKTIADCFKFRNKIGKNIAIEALQDYMRLPGVSLDTLRAHARTNRVENVMNPYLEALL